MKKTILLFLCTAVLAVTSCSKDDDSDAIVGTWAMESSTTFGDTTTSYRDEYKFSENGSGVYSESLNDELRDTYTFSWSNDSGTYTLVYEDETEILTIGSLLGEKTLEDEEGYTIAIKE